MAITIIPCSRTAARCCFGAGNNHYKDLTVDNLRIFGLGQSEKYAFDIANLLGVNLKSVREEWRPDTEPWAASQSNVRGKDVFVVSSLYADKDHSTSDKTMQLLLFIDALKRASAERVTAVCPYLSYMRQDRKDGSREPVATQALAKTMEAAGVDRLLMIDAHNQAAIQNAYRIPVDILEAKKLLVEAFYNQASSGGVDLGNLVVVAPDEGGIKRAKAFQKALTRYSNYLVGIAFADKTRQTSSVVRVEGIVGDVKDKHCIIIDDMISTGRTLAEVDNAISKANGIPLAFIATHGLFLSRSYDIYWSHINTIVTDTVSPWRLPVPVANKLTTVSTTQLFASAIKRIHENDGSISELLT